MLQGFFRSLAWYRKSGGSLVIFVVSIVTPFILRKEVAQAVDARCDQVVCRGNDPQQEDQAGFGLSVLDPVELSITESSCGTDDRHRLARDMPDLFEDLASPLPTGLDTAVNDLIHRIPILLHAVSSFSMRKSKAARPLSMTWKSM